MFERYTEKARRVVFFARYEAGQYGSQYIEPEYMLLGLAREKCPLLQHCFDPGDFLKSLRQEIELQMEIRPRLSLSVAAALSEASSRILKSAAEEARRLTHSHIGTEHILWAILQEEGCLANRILGKHGMKPFVPHEEQIVGVRRPERFRSKF